VLSQTAYGQGLFLADISLLGRKKHCGVITRNEDIKSNTMLDVMFTGRSGASMSLIQVFATIKPRNFIHNILRDNTAIS
jgi:hypothetical protein